MSGFSQIDFESVHKNALSKLKALSIKLNQIATNNVISEEVDFKDNFVVVKYKDVNKLSKLIQSINAITTKHEQAKRRKEVYGRWLDEAYSISRLSNWMPEGYPEFEDQNRLNAIRYHQAVDPIVNQTLITDQDISSRLIYGSGDVISASSIDPRAVIRGTIDINQAVDTQNVDDNTVRTEPPHSLFDRIRNIF